MGQLKTQLQRLRFEVLTTVTVKIHVFWDVTSCSFLELADSIFGENRENRKSEEELTCTYNERWIKSDSWI
jgi:hypothetical protein